MFILILMIFIIKYHNVMSKIKVTENELKTIIRECVINEMYPEYKETLNHLRDAGKSFAKGTIRGASELGGKIKNGLKSGGRAISNFVDGGILKDPQKMEPVIRKANDKGWIITHQNDASFTCQTNLEYFRYTAAGYQEPISIEELVRLVSNELGVQYKWVPSTDKRYFDTPDENGSRTLEYNIKDIQGRLVPVK